MQSTYCKTKDQEYFVSATTMSGHYWFKFEPAKNSRDTQSTFHFGAFRIQDGLEVPPTALSCDHWLHDKRSQRHHGCLVSMPLVSNYQIEIGLNCLQLVHSRTEPRTGLLELSLAWCAMLVACMLQKNFLQRTRFTDALYLLLGVQLSA